MIDNMCKHGRIEGNCIRCKEATIASLREEVERLTTKFERWKIPHTLEELSEIKEQSSQPSLAAKQAYINALEWHFSELRARVEELERELAEERGKVEKVREWKKECGGKRTEYIEWDELEQILEDK